MNEREIERAIDAAARARLSTDAAYLNAENAEQQAARAQEITDEEYERLTGYCRNCGYERLAPRDASRS